MLEESRINYNLCAINSTFFIIETYLDDLYPDTLSLAGSEYCGHRKNKFEVFQSGVV